MKIYQKTAAPERIKKKSEAEIKSCGLNAGKRRGG
jgi:hypothetical protein